jgi:hypothetical protein
MKNHHGQCISTATTPKARAQASGGHPARGIECPTDRQRADETAGVAQHRMHRVAPRCAGSAAPAVSDELSVQMIIP